MPTLKRHLSKSGTRVFDARPDKIDLRDRLYQPRLMNLPALYPDTKLVSAHFGNYQSLVLDQGQEGACTGFGLAAMINYLRFKLVYIDQVLVLEPGERLYKVSPRMLYELARKYDEWAGEDYEGSSCRGAMKGWNKHGVCLAKTWPYGTDKKPGEPLGSWAAEAAKIPLGAYYRVDTRDIAAMHSAIVETGAVYVSADVHSGWDSLMNPKPVPGRLLPTIPWSPASKVDGGHSFALVGFDEEGFFLQNSWGHKWGYKGFGRLTYADWLSNATDCWVGTLGTPITISTEVARTSIRPQSGGLLSGDASPLALAPDPKKKVTDPWDENTAHEHALVMANDGFISPTDIIARDGPTQVKLLGDRIQEWLSSDAKNRDICVYLHGGLNSEEAGFKRVQVMGPWFKANGIFPIFIVWKTGFMESLLDIGADLLDKLLPIGHPSRAAGGFMDWVKERLSDATDYTFENTLGHLGKALWTQMKQNAEAAVKPGRGANLLAQMFAGLTVNNSKARFHAIGHSAGSIWLGRLLEAMDAVKKSPDLTTCHLYAAACTVQFAVDYYIPAIRSGRIPAKRLYFSMMDNQAELADNVAKIYRKSLLYFVSRACEEHKTPILGMEAAWNSNLDGEDIFDGDHVKDEVRKWRNFVTQAKIVPENVLPIKYLVWDGVEKDPPSHGGFDNDIKIVEDTLEIILGTGGLSFPVKNLHGF